MAIANAEGEDTAEDEAVGEEDTIAAVIAADAEVAEEDDADLWLDDEDDFEDAAEADDAAEVEAYDDAFDAEDAADDVQDDEAWLDDEDDADEEPAAAAPAPEAPRPAAAAPRVVKVKRRDFEAAIQDGMLEEDDDAEDEDEGPLSTRTLDLGESSLSPEDEAELQQELLALEAEIARDSGADTSEPAPAAAAPKAEAQPEEDWSYDEDEDDDDLMEAGDSWDDEAWDDDEDDEDVAEAPAPVQPVTPRRQRLLDTGSENDMDRILAETNNQLGDSDGTRRRSAIAHLRAAVAATKAEKQAGSDLTEPDEEEDTDAYREDLAQVVRPRRPAVKPAGDTPTRRTEDRPAPLKLVAEQRVDMTESAPSGPVRPRRIRVADIAKQEEEAERALARREADADHDADKHAQAAAAHAASFTEFAARVGAVDLPDLLEAAASYLAFVEERDQFSRPQLMTKVRQVEQEDFNREDSLRHFGRLLREGKLRKVAGGRFAVSDRINFRPEERAVS